MWLSTPTTRVGGQPQFARQRRAVIADWRSDTNAKWRSDTNAKWRSDTNAKWRSNSILRTAHARSRTGYIFYPISVTSCEVTKTIGRIQGQA